MLLVSGQMESYNIGKRRGALHEIEDQLEVFRPITKWNGRAMTVEEIPELVHTAMQRISTGRPRPVEIEIHWDVLPATADIELLERRSFPGKARDPLR